MITVAIAEDHISLSDGLQLFLEQESDIKVAYTTTNGIQLLSQFENNPTDVILTDISMPEMNGIELCKIIKSRFYSTKVIALTMFDNTGAIKEMLEAGVDGYVLKSSPLIDLRQAVREVFQGGKYFDIHIEKVVKEIQCDKLSKSTLSRSEREILQFIAKGLTSQQIAEIRGSAISTVNKHRKNMIQKLGLSGKRELLVYAMKQHGHSNS